MICRAADKPDTFEQIAKTQLTTVPGVVAVPAPKLPDVALPWDDKPKAGFQPGEKIETQAQLDVELQRMRQTYAPFMADLAPAIPQRPLLELENFDWRYQTPEDLKDPSRAGQGAGDWKKVTIPHYWGPVGPATSYYRAEIVLDDKMLSLDALYLHFQGADYIADIYVNDQHVGAHEGLFDAFEFNIKPLVKVGKNILLVKLQNNYDPIGSTGAAPRHHGPKMSACGGPGWDDPKLGWVCCPSGFGLWQRAWIDARPGTFVHDIFVRPMPQKNQAEVWVELERTKPDAAGVTATYSLYGQNFKATVAENQAITLPDDAPEISPNVRLYKFLLSIPAEQLRWWSPDEPWLYQIQIQVHQGDQVTDARSRQFGMRTFMQSSTSTPKGRFYLNGKEIRLRGANMMGNIMQCVIRKDFNQLRDDILLAKIAHMNFWRMTQQPCQEEAYDYFDRLGLLAQTDMPTFGAILKVQVPEATRQATAMARLVRSHPCNCVITYINEPMTETPGNKLSSKEMVSLFGQWDQQVAAVNPDQVIKWVDGDYLNLTQTYLDHHCYTLWYRGHGIDFRALYAGAWIASRQGWMHGCGEYGAEGLDSIPFMKKHYPAAWLVETPDGNWNPKLIPMCQTVTNGVNAWYGKHGTMQDWVDTSRDHQMWADRLQTEAYRRDPLMNSCAIHLLIDAWPAGWMKAVMDYDRQAKPAYFAFRDALTPLAVNLRPDNFYAISGAPVRIGAWVCNDTQIVPAGAMLRYEVQLGDKILQTGNAPANIVACEPEFQGFFKLTAPEVDKRQPMTVRLGLFDANGKLLHDTAVDLDLFPASAKDQKLDHPGGTPQRCIKS